MPDQRDERVGSFAIENVPINLSARAPFSERAKTIGNKAANLETLNDTFKDQVELRVKIPEICPLSHTHVQAHLDQYAPAWRVLWQTFVERQGNEKAFLKESARDALSELRAMIIKTFEDHPLSDESLGDYLSKLIKQDAAVNLMVRSTGAEDTLEVANPGGNESIAAVKPDEQSINHAIGQVIASYFSEKSLTQRLLSGSDITEEPFMPVLLQRMIGEPINGLQEKENIVRSGVMYTGNAATNIQLAPGHGELIVNSKAPFDTYVVTNNDLVYPEIHKKAYRLVPTEEHDQNGVMKRQLTMINNPKELQTTPAISQAVALKIAQAGRLIEAHYGMPMDVEFVYDPKDDYVYLVQARPIPKGDLKNVLPSSIPPERMPELKKLSQDGAIDFARVSVITSAGNAARVVTAKDEVLICRTLGEALERYLAEPHSAIKAVVVEEMAPQTSHEAAQFNSKAIPVLQTPDIQLIKEWVEKDNSKPVLIIDPQRNQIVNYRNQLDPSVTNIEQALYDQGLLNSGLFTLSTTPITPLPIQISEEKIRSMFPEKEINQLLDRAKQMTKNGAINYSSLIENLAVIESAKAGSDNQESIEALENIQAILLQLALSEKGQKLNLVDPHLLQYAMIASFEIKQCLQSYQHADNAENTELRQALLSSVSRLRSIILYPGAQTVFSESIIQAAQEKKAIDRINLPGVKNLDQEQLDYLTQFMKFSKLALSESDAIAWQKFALDCAANREDMQTLAQLAAFSIANGIESSLINICFTKHQQAISERAITNPSDKQKTLMSRAVLSLMRDEMSQTALELNAINLQQKNDLIQSWVRRIGEWSDPVQFNKLWQDYQKDIIPLINELNLDDNMSPLAKQSILKTIYKLTELMDLTIKSVKGSAEYQDVAMQVENFRTLLTPYHQLMIKMLESIPEEQYEEWASCIHDNRQNNYRTSMLLEINKKFDSLSKISNDSQLHPSGEVSVESARVGSTASFFRQFVIKNVTLEDMFTLFHQNILSSISYHTKQFGLKIDQMPKPIKPLLQEIQKHSKFQLSKLDHHYPLIIISYNYPLANHSANFTIEYNQETKNTTFYGNVFGMNASNRMTRIQEISELEGNALGFQTSISSPYSEKNNTMEFTWKIAESQLNDQAIKIPNALLAYGDMTADCNDALEINCMHLIDRVGFNTDIIKRMIHAVINKQKATFEEKISIISKMLYKINNDDDFKVACSYMVDLVFNQIKSRKNLVTLLYHLSSPQITLLLPYIQDKLPEIIQSMSDLQELFDSNNLNRAQRCSVYFSLQNNLSNIVTTSSDLACMLSDVSPKDGIALCKNLKNFLVIVPSSQELKEILSDCPVSREELLKISLIHFIDKDIDNIEQLDRIQKTRRHTLFSISNHTFGADEKTAMLALKQAVENNTLIDQDQIQILSSGRAANVMKQYLVQYRPDLGESPDVQQFLQSFSKQTPTSAPTNT